MYRRSPEVPSGYGWLGCPDLNIGFPTPLGWSAIASNDYWGNPIVLTSAEKLKSFDDLGTCLVVTRIRINTSLPFSPVREARRLLSGLEDVVESLGDIDVRRVSGFMVFRREFIGSDTGRVGNLPVHYWTEVAADMERNSIIKLIFRTPEVYALEDSRIARTILDRRTLGRIL